MTFVSVLGPHSNVTLNAPRVIEPEANSAKMTRKSLTSLLWNSCPRSFLKPNSRDLKYTIFYLGQAAEI